MLGCLFGLVLRGVPGRGDRKCSSPGFKDCLTARSRSPLQETQRTADRRLTRGCQFSYCFCKFAPMVSRAFCGPIDRGSEGATEGEIFKAAFPPLLTLPEFPLTRLTSGHLRLRPHDRAEVYPSPAEGLRARAWARRHGPPPCPRTELDSAGPRPASPSRPGTRGPPHAAGWLRGSCPGSAPGCACPTEAPGRAACRADPLPTAPRGSRVRRRHRDRADAFQPVHLRPASRAHAHAAGLPARFEGGS